MPAPYAWVELRTPEPATASTFYQELLGWKVTSPQNPGEPHLVTGADDAPWASIASHDGFDARVWLAYVQVDDVDKSTDKARELGGTVLTAAADGPEGRYSVIKDPTGAAIALWQPR